MPSQLLQVIMHAPAYVDTQVFHLCNPPSPCREGTASSLLLLFCPEEDSWTYTRFPSSGNFFPQWLRSLTLSLILNCWTSLQYFKKFYCSSTVLCLSPTPAQPPALPTSLPFPPPKPRYCPYVPHNCSYKPFTLFPWNSLPSPLWSLSAHSQFHCLWLYFACLLVLLIRFLLKVRSYGICLLFCLLTGDLSHLHLNSL